MAPTSTVPLPFCSSFTTPHTPTTSSFLLPPNKLSPTSSPHHHPLSSSRFFAAKLLLPLPPNRPPLLLVRARPDSSVEPPDRILAAAGYLLPLLDGVQYGRYLFLQFPPSQLLIRPLVPVLQAYRSVPFASFAAFFALYLLVVRNPSLSRYVRFNTMQAVVLDVLLIFPSLVERTFNPRGGVGFDLLVIFDNTVFLYLVACFLFGTVSCVLGLTPRLPLVADAADAQVM